MKSLLRLAAVGMLAALGFFSATPASAQFGVQAGYSIDPDQVVLGGHYTIPVGESGLRLVPGAEVAFGDELFTIYFNGDVHYLFKTSGSVRPYIGAGATYAIYDPDAEGADANDEFGVNAIGGLWLNTKGSTPWFLEGKFGLTDEMADAKIMVGLGF